MHQLAPSPPPFSSPISSCCLCPLQSPGPWAHSAVRSRLICVRGRLARACCSRGSEVSLFAGGILPTSQRGGDERDDPEAVQPVRREAAGGAAAAQRGEGGSPGVYVPLLTEQPGSVGRIIVGGLYRGRCVLGGELVDSNVGLVGAHSLLSLPPPSLYSPSSISVSRYTPFSSQSDHLPASRLILQLCISSPHLLLLPCPNPAYAPWESWRCQHLHEWSLFPSHRCKCPLSWGSPFFLFSAVEFSCPCY